MIASVIPVSSSFFTPFGPHIMGFPLSLLILLPQWFMIKVCSSHCLLVAWVIWFPQCIPRIYPVSVHYLGCREFLVVCHGTIQGIIKVVLTCSIMW